MEKEGIKTAKKSPPKEGKQKKTRKTRKRRVKEDTPVQAEAEAQVEDVKEDIQEDIQKDIQEDDPQVESKTSELRKTEIAEYKENGKGKEDPNIDALYPTINDPFFSDKISRRREYEHMRFDGDIRDIEAFSNYLCENPYFELMPHQLFVRNFISRNTPYNSVLLYHGLGSGKTCSAIGIAEEMREYAKQTGSSQRIMVIASTNVQDNFRTQLFDERNLKKENENWNIKSCIGNKLLKEINPTGDKGLQREGIVSQINTIINSNYAFMGYLQLANYIIEHVMVPTTATYTSIQKRKLEIQNIKKHFNNRLIIIDEVHNIHLHSSSNENKIAKLLLKVAKYADNMKLILLSATPVYNSVKEIIWLTNLMNVNDKRAEIEVSEVFTGEGKFVKGKKESGDDLLRRKLTGYVSYVRGENPYTFPFRVYPEFFAREKTFLNMEYPSKTLSNKPIKEPLKYLNGRLYVNQIGEEQELGYKFIIENMIRFSRRKGEGLFFLDESKASKEPDYENMEGYGYSELQSPLQALIMMYPSPLLTTALIDSKTDPISKEMFKEVTSKIIGKDGLRSVMDFVEEQTEIDLNPNRAESEEKKSRIVFKKYNFEYKKGTTERIFHKDHLHKYSSKIASICDIISRSRGIVLIYTQYIDGGIVPMALALEEMGFTRTGTGAHVQPLFKKLTTRSVGIRKAVDPLNAVDLRPLSEMGKEGFSQAKYMILSGDKYFSHNNTDDIKIATNSDNVDGKNVRVILISKAASEGLDFKCIRQVHILDPWYNMNRIEQIIGRGVRNQSHCKLHFKDRNVEVYLHATTLSNKTIECADLYVYRYAEKKAVAIGEINRIMKTVAVDCRLNISQTHFTDERLGKLAENQRIKIRTSTCADPEGKPFIIKDKNGEDKYGIGDRPFSEACDYMECNYTCPRMKGSINESDSNSAPKINIEATYHKENIKANSALIIEKIKELYTDSESGKKEGDSITVKSFHRDAIIKRLTTSTNPFGIRPKINIKEIDFALTEILENPNEIIVDNLGRTGRIVNRGKYYLFQPIELNDAGSSILESSLPVQSKAKNISFETKKAEVEVEVEAEVEAKAVAEVEAEAKAKESDKAEVLSHHVDEYATLLKQFSEKFNLVKNDIPNEIKSGNLDWYIHINSEIKQTNTKELMRDQFGLTDGDIEKYAVYHMLDTLPYINKAVVAKYVVENQPASELETHIFNYFNGDLEDEGKTQPLIFRSDNDKMIKVLIADKNKNTMITKDLETNVWENETPEDDSNFISQVKASLEKPINSFSDFFGFVGDYEKKGSHSMVFRVKRMGQKRNNTGAYLQGFVKKIVVDRFNMLIAAVVKTVKTNPQKYKGTVAEKIYNNAPKNIAITEDGVVINPQFSVNKMDISQVSICGIVEMIIRKLNDDDPDGTTWFLTTEEAILNKVELIV
jgi:superfamily II DNA or RNA helicase